MSADRYSVAVRSMCEFTAKRGDLDIRFTPATSAAEGMAGHRVIGARRGGSYQCEVTLRGEFGSLTVRGRADGYDPSLRRLEEYKTHRGDLTRMAENKRGLHWAQLKIYGALLCRQQDLGAIDLALVYFDVRSGRETPLHAHFLAQALYREFDDHCERFLGWSRREITHRLRRDEFLAALPFPHADLPPLQRRLAEAVYKAARSSQTIMLQAPTGIGKTIGTLYPLLKAMPKQKLDKIFFLVAKTSGRRAALDTMKLLLAGDTPSLRVLEYVAKDSACEYPGRPCSPASCPLANGFYDRLPQARVAAIDAGFLDQATLRRVALAAQVCPYYLTQELVRWCDVIIADYNYYFSSSASLHALTLENQWRVALLVDEAHNLVARARDMYSATLLPRQFSSARKAAPPPIRLLLDGIERAWAPIAHAGDADYSVMSAIPAPLLAAIEHAVAVMLDGLADDPGLLGGDLQEFFFALLEFSRLAAAFDQHSLFDASTAASDDGRAGDGLPRLCIRNIVPAPFLTPRFAASTVTILFSATLAPADYYRQLLGLAPATSWIAVDSPFHAGQLAVRVASRISTRFADRRRSIGPIVDRVRRQYVAAPGNYLAFFSSFDYLARVLTAFRDRHREIDTWEQSRAMRATERDAFLARFRSGGAGIGFAVLGGSFGEGIDLPGDRLIGAFIVTLGLPAFNPMNRHIERRMQSLFGRGFEYAYLYPGLQRVVQAAGRVIRGPLDTGTVHLIDDRFTRPQVRALLPTWWHVEID